MQDKIIWLYIPAILLISIFGCSHKPHKQTHTLDRLPNSSHTLLPPKDILFEGNKIRVTELSNVKYPEASIDSDDLLMVVHASDVTDPKRMTLLAVQNAKKYIESNNGRQLQLAMTDEIDVGDHKIFPLGEKYVFPFQGDSHRISHSGKRLILTGGNLTRCLCTALDSYLAFRRFRTTKEITIFLVTDGIYEGFYENPNALKSNQTNLEIILSSLSNSEFKEFLLQRFIGKDGRLCPYYSSIKFVENPALSYKFNIYREGKYLLSAGDGKIPVELNFVTSSSLLKDPIE